ncbi:MAG: glycosyltransferase [Gammaproteobacteria bacterium]|nr:glycosyltransferase [Gammaproteobacteria bacterium]
MKKFCIVIPAYNESGSIADIALRARRYCDHVVVIDDGSTDNTVELVEKLDVVLLRNPENEGKAVALSRGIVWALEQGLDYVITLDGDGQHEPEDIPRFIEAALANPDKIIIGSRMANKAAFPAKRYYANRIASFWISWTAGYPIQDSQSGFRLYPVDLFKKLTIKKTRAYGFVFESEILIKAARLGITSLSIPIEAIYKDHARPSHFRPVLDIVRITIMVGWRMTSRLMHPVGFYKAFIRPRFQRTRAFSLGREGFFSFVLANLLVLLTGGLILLVRMREVYFIARNAPDHVEAADWIMVLGRHVRREFERRLDKVVDLARQYPESRILVLGGKPRGVAISEARLGRDYLLNAGIDESRILLEQESLHTLENMLNARTLLGERTRKPVVIVTSRYHLARARGLANSLGIPHELCAAEPRLEPGPTLLGQVLAESYYVHWLHSARLWARITGRTGHVGPLQH